MTHSQTAQTPFPFLIGCERSGTTLARAMLDAHPDLAIPAESYFVVKLCEQRERYERNGTVDLELLLADLESHPPFAKWGLAADDVLRALKLAEPGDLSEAIRVLFALQAKARGKTRYGDKTPAYVVHISLLASMFPEARFVHLIRDGRDVANSIRDVARLGDPDDREFLHFAEAAQHWKRRVSEGRHQGALLGPSRYRELHYEALVSDPEAELASVCDFVQLEFRPEMLDHTKRSRQIALGFEDPRIQNNLHRPVTSNIRDWRRDLSPRDLAVFDLIAGDLLEELGYERSAPGATALARLDVAALWLRDLARTARRRVERKLKSARNASKRRSVK